MILNQLSLTGWVGNLFLNVTFWSTLACKLHVGGGVCLLYWWPNFLMLRTIPGHTGQLTDIWLCSLCYWEIRENFYSHTLVHVLGKQHSWDQRVRAALLMRNLQEESHLGKRSHDTAIHPSMGIVLPCQSKRTWLWFVKVALCLEAGWEATSEWALRAIL